MNGIDTNIWIYSLDARDPAKQVQATELIERLDPQALPWQVACEFLAAGRKLHPYGISEEELWAAHARMIEVSDRLLLPHAGLWPICKRLRGKYPLSFWDGMLLAACVDGGITHLYTEDFTSAKPIEGVTIVNPFVEALG